MAQQGCMSNKCRRVITLHALAEIRSILQIKENNLIRRQTLIYAGRGMVAVHFLPELQYPEGTGKVIYKPSIFYEEQLHLKQNRLRNHKMPSSL